MDLNEQPIPIKPVEVRDRGSYSYFNGPGCLSKTLKKFLYILDGNCRFRSHYIVNNNNNHYPQPCAAKYFLF